MTQEEKQLLIKDLCARLPYGLDVEIKGRYDDGERYIRISTLDITMLGYIYDDEASIIPYLRPMSSMTEEETIKYVTLTHYNTDDNGKPYRELTIEAIDWLNENHFDYRGLIPMGLSLKAPEGMYKNE